MSKDPRIVLVCIDEADIQTTNLDLDYPVPDETLAQLLEKIEAQRPRVIGLDIYRDKPVASCAEGQNLSCDEQHQLLNQVLLSNANIICIFRIPDPNDLEGVKPPPVIADQPDRIAFNDLPNDGNEVRRSLVAQSVGTTQFLSLAWSAAIQYIEQEDSNHLFEPDPAHPGRSRPVLRFLEHNDGPYVNLDAAGEQFLMDFRGPRTFQTISGTELIRERLPTNTFSDKVVLVGMTAHSVKDDLYTPLKRPLRGIEIHAQVINQLLRIALNGDRQLAFWADWQKDAWTLLWCLVGGAVGYAVRSPWRSSGLLGAALVVLGGLAWWAFSVGWWIPVATPAIACIATAVSVNWYISYQEKMQRQMIMQLFSKQVSREVAETIWAQRNEFLEGGRPRAQQLKATVLYTDLEGYSSLAESLEPAVVMDWLNEYMGMMAEAVIGHHGVIDKFIGDAVMALFGVPLARKTDGEVKEDAVNAVRCALAMEQGLARLNTVWAGQRLPTCRMRVGIHTGHLVAGSVGGTERMEYTVIGDTVNTASRLESFDKDRREPDLAGRCCRVLIGESTRDLAGDQFETRRVGQAKLKGKDQEVTIYLVLKEISQT